MTVEFNTHFHFVDNLISINVDSQCSDTKNVDEK